MDLLVETLIKEVKSLADKGVRLRTIGDTGALPASCQAQLGWRQSKRPTSKTSN